MHNKVSSLVRRAWQLAALALVMLFILAAPLTGVQAGAGELDPGFGDGGKVMVDFAGASDMAYAMATQADGKLVLAGFSIIGESPRVVASRLDMHGKLDPTFGTDGKVVLDIARHATAVAVQPDGKIVIVGTTGDDFLVLRLDQNGQLDKGNDPGNGIGLKTTPGFGDGGVVITDFMAAVDEAKAVAIQPDGRIVVAGTATDRQTGMPQFAVARYDALGHLDPSFGVDGKLMIQLSVYSHQVSGLALLPEGKILIVGSAFVNETGIADFALCCLNSDGSFYEKFGKLGLSLTEFAGFSALAHAVAIQADGKIVVGGSVADLPSRRANGALARFDALGKLDESFGSTGQVIVESAFGPEPILSLALQGDGKIVAGSYAFVSNSTSAFLVERFDQAGAADLRFGSAGKVTTEFPGNAAEVFSLTIVGDRSIIAAGYAGDSGHNLDFALACYNVSVPAPTTYDLCLQDNDNGCMLRLNSTTGDYVFTNCRKGISISGKGVVSGLACKVFLQGATADHRLSATLNSCTHVGTATLKSYAAGKTYSINDSNMSDDTGVCP